MEKTHRDPHASSQNEVGIAAQRLAYVVVDSILRGKKRFERVFERVDCLRTAYRQRKAASIVQCFHRNDPDPVTAQVSPGHGQRSHAPDAV
ncbi:MAG TPA: hypothetical protein VJV77_16655 [Casimicrobiaceae bacterium]|nr:hypothetical protein [Casimicrobiaceae bacterium]